MSKRPSLAEGDDHLLAQYVRLGGTLPNSEG